MYNEEKTDANSTMRVTLDAVNVKVTETLMSGASTSVSFTSLQ